MLGILSERDIIRAIAASGQRAGRTPVSRYMTSKVVTCTMDTLIVDLMEDMTKGRFRHIPVVENDRLSGIVSIGDVVKHRLAEVQHETEALREYSRRPEGFRTSACGQGLSARRLVRCIEPPTLGTQAQRVCSPG